MQNHDGISASKQIGNGRITQLREPRPRLFELFSIVTLCAEEVSRHGQMDVRQAAWYEKEAATFADAIAVVRRRIWSSQSFQTSVLESDVIKVPRELFERLIESLCYAA